jgi:hypothetical protein
VNCRRAGAHQKEALENIADPPRAVLRVLGLDRPRLLPDFLRHPADPAGRHLRRQPRLPVKPVGSHSALDRMRADPKLLHQQPNAVALFEEQLHDPQPELHLEGHGPHLPLGPGCGALGCARHRVTSSPCKWFFTLGSVTQFS